MIVANKVVLRMDCDRIWAFMERTRAASHKKWADTRRRQIGRRPEHYNRRTASCFQYDVIGDFLLLWRRFGKLRLRFFLAGMRCRGFVLGWHFGKLQPCFFLTGMRRWGFAIRRITCLRMAVGIIVITIIVVSMVAIVIVRMVM